MNAARIKWLFLVLPWAIPVTCDKNPIRNSSKTNDFFGDLEPGYTNPTINPVDGTIGFDHSRVLRLSHDPSGYVHTVLDDSGGGFFLMSWADTTMRRVTEETRFALTVPTRVGLILRASSNMCSQGGSSVRGGIRP